MRLLYLGSTDFPQPKARAIQIVNTCHALARAGAEVTLVVGRRGRPERGLAAFGLAPHPRLRFIGLPVLRIPPTSPPAVLRRFTRLWQASYLLGLAVVAPRELLLGRPDLVYARDLRTAALAGGPAHAAGARLGFEVHGLPSFEARSRAPRSNLAPTAAGRLRRLEAKVFERADRIVTITECARQILLDSYGLEPSKVRTIADGTRAFTPPPNTLPDAERGDQLPSPLQGGAGGGVGPPTPAVYYLGQLYPWKGAGLLVEASARVSQARFVVVGGLPYGRGSDPEIAELADRARRLGTADRIEFRGYVPYGRVAQELSNASVVVLPLPDEPAARYFTSPLKLFDYMASGAPIVASDLPSVREVLRQGDNALLVPPDDPAALAQAIERLLAEPALARRLGSQARQDVRAYTWDARASRLLEFLGAER